MTINALLCITLLFVPSFAFYLPGVAPREFQDEDIVEIKVNKLSSIKTLLPYDYYSLDFCKPKDGIETVAENLGEFLSGDKIENSPYELFMNRNEFCKILCQKKLTRKSISKFADAIRKEYHHNWIIDNLPAATIIESDNTEITSYVRGFPIGEKVDRAIYINNHVNIRVDYHSIAENQHRVVGFFVEPLSIKHKFSAPFSGSDFSQAPLLETCDYNSMTLSDSVREKQKLEEGDIIYTYSVEWKPSDIQWASRWDIYLSMNNAIPDQVHWFSIINSLVILIFLSGMIAMILLRNLYKDIARYNRVPTDEEKAEEREETGWKLIHADIFRQPAQQPMIFCVLIGTGVQLFFMGLFTIIFAAIGFLSPANRGSLMIALLLLFALMGCFGGYYSARLYKTFKGKQWQKCTIFTAFAFSGFAFSIFIIFNFIAWIEGSTQAIPFLYIIVLLCIWFGVTVPLVFCGAYIGFRKEPITFPCVSGNILRPIPDQPWYLGAPFMILVGGILPFGACFVELFFILSSIWMGQYYYVFGFLFLVFAILTLTCAEISIVLCYFQLCNEDYNWWWRSFLTSASTGLYVYLYSIIYFGRLHTNYFITYLFYFGYMAIISIAIALMMGCVGFFACLWFTKKIYSSIKVD